MLVRSLGQEDPLKKGVATHASILAWRIPWAEELGRLQYIVSSRVGHDWSDLARTHRDVNCTSCIRSTESQALDCQGSPLPCFKPKSSTQYTFFWASLCLLNNVLGVAVCSNIEPPYHFCCLYHPHGLLNTLHQVGSEERSRALVSDLEELDLEVGQAACEVWGLHRWYWVWSQGVGHTKCQESPKNSLEAVKIKWSHIFLSPHLSLTIQGNWS